MSIPEDCGVTLCDIMRVLAKADSTCTETLEVCAGCEFLVMCAVVISAHLGPSVGAWCSAAARVFVAGRVGHLVGAIQLIVAGSLSGLWCSGLVHAGGV